MNTKPIGSMAHGAIDYGFVTAQLLAPSLLKFGGPTWALCYGFAAFQEILNALTDHPLGMLKVVPLRAHGQLETPFVPALSLLPWATGALKQPRARAYLLAFFAIALANFVLSDYNAYEP